MARPTRDDNAASLSLCATGTFLGASGDKLLRDAAGELVEHDEDDTAIALSNAVLKASTMLRAVGGGGSAAVGAVGAAGIMEEF